MSLERGMDKNHIILPDSISVHMHVHVNSVNETRQSKAATPEGNSREKMSCLRNVHYVHTNPCSNLPRPHPPPWHAAAPVSCSLV